MLIAAVAGRFRNDASGWWCEPRKADANAILGRPGLYSSLESADSPILCNWVARDVAAGTSRVVGTIPDACGAVSELAFSPDGSHGLAVVVSTSGNARVEAAWEVDFHDQRVEQVSLPRGAAGEGIGYDERCELIVVGTEAGAENATETLRQWLGLSPRSTQAAAWIRRRNWRRIATGRDAEALQDAWKVRLYRGSIASDGSIVGGTLFQPNESVQRGFVESEDLSAPLSAGLVWVAAKNDVSADALQPVRIAGVPISTEFWSLRARARVGTREIALEGTAAELHVRIDGRWVLFEDTVTGGRASIVDRADGEEVWRSGTALFVTAWPTAAELEAPDTNRD